MNGKNEPDDFIITLTFSAVHACIYLIVANLGAGKIIFFPTVVTIILLVTTPKVCEDIRNLMFINCFYLFAPLLLVISLYSIPHSIFTALGFLLFYPLAYWLIIRQKEDNPIATYYFLPHILTWTTLVYIYVFIFLPGVV